MRTFETASEAEYWTSGLAVAYDPGWVALLARDEGPNNSASLLAFGPDGPVDARDLFGGRYYVRRENGTLLICE